MKISRIRNVVAVSMFAGAPISSALIIDENTEVEEAGLCVQELGCSSGPTKCADGVLTTSSGTQVQYICYTTIRPQ